MPSSEPDAASSRLRDDLWRPDSWSVRAAAPSPEFGWVELSIVAAIVFYNPISNRLLPPLLYVPANLTVAGVILALAIRSGMPADLFGVDRTRAGKGARVGLIASTVAVAAVVALAFAPWSRAFFEDDRVAGVGVGEMLYQSLVRIPLGTALAEEVMFRGVLVGIFLLHFSVLRAAALSSVLFGLWHVLPTLSALETNPAGDLLGGLTGATSAVAGGVTVTFLAGMGFAWLRFRASSLLAPILVHAAINSTSYVAGWLIVRNGWS